MIKKGIIILLFVLVAAVIILYPRSFYQVMGVEAESSIRATSIAEKEFRISPGTAKEIQDDRQAEKILEFFCTYHYRKANIDYDQLDAIPVSFSVTFTSEEGDKLRIVTSGDEYATFFHNGSSETVKVFQDKFDLDMLKQTIQEIS